MECCPTTRVRPEVPRALLAAGAVLLASAGASANGAFPDEFSVHFPPGASHRILIGANFGLLVSEDDGLTWRYSCEPWVTSGSNAALTLQNVSFYQVAIDGAFLADSLEGVSRSADVACTWPSSTIPFAGQSVADIFADPANASRVVVILQRLAGSSIALSRDGGGTFDPTPLYDTVDLLTGVELARSRPGVIYATSISTTGGPSRFLASLDAGDTWSATALSIGSRVEPRLLAIDPDDEKRVWLRLVGGLTDAVALTTDGGQTFQTVLNLDGPLSSFLRAGDGTVYLGMRSGRIYSQAPGASTFTARAAPHLRCLGQRPGSTAIYACTDLINDGYDLARSDDGGQTFQPVMSFRQLLGPLECAPVQANCQAHWDRIQGVLGIRPDAGTAGDGGGADAGGSAGGGGSHCGSAGGGPWAALWLAGLAALRTRARQRRVALARRGPAV